MKLKALSFGKGSANTKAEKSQETPKAEAHKAEEPKQEEPKAEESEADSFEEDVRSDLGTLGEASAATNARIDALEATIAEQAATNKELAAKLEALSEDQSEKVKADAAAEAARITASQGTPPENVPGATTADGAPTSQEDFMTAYRDMNASDPKAAAAYWNAHASKFN